MLETAHLIDIDDLDLLHRCGNMPVRSRPRLILIGAKAQHETALALADDIEAGGQPENRAKEQNADQPYRPGIAAATLALAATKIAEFGGNLLQQLVEIGRPLIVAVAPSPRILVVSTWLIPRHSMFSKFAARSDKRSDRPSRFHCRRRRGRNLRAQHNTDGNERRTQSSRF